MYLNVSLVDYPSIQSITKQITVIITCVVQILTFSTVPEAWTTFIVGIDSQPSICPYTISKTPACGNLV